MLHASRITADIPFFGSARAHADMADLLKDAAMRVLMSGQSLQGSDVSSFEERVALAAGRGHGVAVGSATDGLFFVLRSLGVGEGDKVLVPALSFVASASCILRCGAVPVFVDVDAAGHIDLHAAATHLTPATKAILAVHLYGNMIEPRSLLDFAEQHGLHLIEDAAQCFGAIHSTRPAGALGAASIFSFDPTKVIGAPGSGGAVVTDDADLAARITALRYHGKGGNKFDRLGYNSQMSTLVAAVLNLKLDRHAEWTAARQRIARRFDAALAGKDAILQPISPEVYHVRHKYAFLSDRRTQLAEHLKAHSIPTRRHYRRILPDEPLFTSASIASGNGDFPMARMIADRTLSLPIHAYLKDEEVERTARALQTFFG